MTNHLTLDTLRHHLVEGLAPFLIIWDVVLALQTVHGRAESAVQAWQATHRHELERRRTGAVSRAPADGDAGVA